MHKNSILLFYFRLNLHLSILHTLSGAIVGWIPSFPIKFLQFLSCSCSLFCVCSISVRKVLFLLRSGQNVKNSADVYIYKEIHTTESKCSEKVAGNSGILPDRETYASELHGVW